MSSTTKKKTLAKTSERTLKLLKRNAEAAKNLLACNDIKSNCDIKNRDGRIPSKFIVNPTMSSAARLHSIIKKMDRARTEFITWGEASLDRDVIISQAEGVRKLLRRHKNDIEFLERSLPRPPRRRS